VPEDSTRSSGRRKQREAPKRAKLIATLRRQIVTGRLKPAEQMPTRAALERQHGVSRITVQHALDTLRRDGLVVTRGRAGTFVADHPPHRRRFAVVFPTHPASRRWSMRYEAMEIATRRIEKHRDIELVSYYDVTARGAEPAFEQLCADCRAGLIGGIIHAHPPYHWDREGQADPASGLPQVSLSRTQVGDRPIVCDGDPDFIERACELLAELGCERIACIGLGATGMSVRDFAAHADEQTRRHGMATPPGWVVPVHHQMPETAHAVARLLMDRAPADRPDGVLVTDDHLAEQVTQGLASVGMEAAQRVKVVLHVNFPLVPASVLPVYRLGSDVGEHLSHAVDLIERQQRGESVPRACQVPIRDEQEIQTAPGMRMGRTTFSPAATPPSAPPTASPTPQE